MRAIAIIPARGGSKRIPRKNLVDLCGKPLLAWTIEAALKSDCFEQVVVSTDDEEIAEVGRNFGAQVPFLRTEHFDDYAPSAAATLSALRQAEDYFGTTYEIVSQLMATTPLRGAEQISKAFEHFRASGAPSQLSCIKFEWQNPWWSITLDDLGRPVSLFPDLQMSRSQDLPDVFAPSGAVWFAKCEVLKREATFYTNDHRFFPIDWCAGIDIDVAEDFELARRLKISLERSENESRSLVPPSFKVG